MTWQRLASISSMTMYKSRNSSRHFWGVNAFNKPMIWIEKKSSLNKRRYFLIIFKRGHFSPFFLLSLLLLLQKSCPRIYVSLKFLLTKLDVTQVDWSIWVLTKNCALIWHNYANPPLMEPHIQATWIQPIRMLGYFSQQKNRQSWTTLCFVLYIFS